MTRYITICANSGYIFGDVEAEDALDAGVQTDREANAHSRIEDYSWSGPVTYFVYEAPEGFPVVENGQDQATIDAVEARCRYVGAISRAAEVA